MLAHAVHCRSQRNLRDALLRRTASAGEDRQNPRLRNPPFKLAADQFEVIGIVEDAMHELQNGDARPELYIPYSIAGVAETLVVHTAGDPMSMAPLVRSQIYAIDPAQPIDETRTLEPD